ncbi:HIT-like domain [Dillenia turbinata]|uniref:HIT-like domain n=1 Tax=Dillenia turbinata TaxID=194707 RepID=A0AAN8Z6Y9_9MAGN
MASGYYKFGPYKVDEHCVFYVTDLSFAMVNLRPACPEYLMYPKGVDFEIHTDQLQKLSAIYFFKLNSESLTRRREVKRVVDLTPEEICDMWLTAQKVGSQLEIYHRASSLTLNIQDGPVAGQTVPHVHIHILPRKEGDFERNDDIYDAIDKNEVELKRKLVLDEDRNDRNLDEMAEEADEYRKLFA